MRPIWQEAISFAARAHRHQVRRDGKTPYVAHVTRVMMTVSQVFGCDDEEALAAAALHDTIEDTTTDYDDLEDRFGKNVAEIVAALTKNMAMSEQEREAEYDARLAKSDWRARLIKLGDVYDNYVDVATTPEESREEKRGKALEKCHRAIAIAKRDVKAHPEIARAVRALKALIEENVERIAPVKKSPNRNSRRA